MPAPNDLVTLAQAYGWLGMAQGTDDTNLQLAISAYSQLIADFCSRSIVLATFSEIYDGRDMPRLMLRNYPIVAVTSLSIYGVAQSPATSPYGPGYTFANRSVDLQGGAVFTRGLGNIAISYQAGFNPIPADIQMACLDWLKASYLMRTEKTAVVSHRAGDTEEKFAPGGAVTTLKTSVVPMPATVFATLSQYQNTLPV